MSGAEQGTLGGDWMNEELWYFNGVDGATGEYLLPPMSPARVGALARGESWDEAQFRELKWRREQANAAHLGVIEGVDRTKLAEAGWGIIFAHGAEPAVRDAL